MPARPIDAAEGYRLFRRVGGAIELDEINEYLRGLELREVSPRMLVHYRRLYRHGYESYIPINRLDIALAGEDAWSDELQARYPEIAQGVEAELIWGAATQEVLVESLTAAIATVIGEPPPVKTSVVLRLLTTGIERAGTVIRADRVSGRFHVSFDPYTSVPVAGEDSPVTAMLRIDLPPSAQNLVAIADVILSLDRYLVRADPRRQFLTRVRRIGMGSPLDILISGRDILREVLILLGSVILLRKQWYEGTKAKYEAEGIQLDSEQREASAQSEADTDLQKQLRREVDADSAPLLKRLQQPHLPLGDPGSPERQQLSDAAQAAVDLPLDLTVHPEPDAVEPEPVEGDHGS